MTTPERAIALAARAHECQVNQAGEPYILGPLRMNARGRVLPNSVEVGYALSNPAMVIQE